MGRRYVRVFACEDCGCRVERKWQRGRPMVCIDCAHVRFVLVTDGVKQLLDEYKRLCRLELLAGRVPDVTRAAETAIRGAIVLQGGERR